MNKNKVAISQSNYIPWKGYFDLIASVDIFVLYDDMQYTKRDWRNRNKIKTRDGLRWLSIPVQVKGKYLQKINETEVVDAAWAEKHWAQLESNYRSAEFFEQTAAWLRPIYEQVGSLNLSEINKKFICQICCQLGIETTILDSSQFDLGTGKTERLVEISRQLKATHYCSGPAAKDYLDQTLFNQHGIEVIWFDYSGYPEYPQLWDEFEHSVTILDLLFCTGPNAQAYMKNRK